MKRLLLHSPVGPLLAEYDGRGVRALHFWRQGIHPPAGTRDAPERGDRLGAAIVEELREYFSGARTRFSLPLVQEGTAFQRAVWSALAAIPWGETRSYAEVAGAIGRPGAARAVGQANARNAIPIVVPCHRVLAAGGGLGGYLGASAGEGGLAIKEWLLTHERGPGGGGERRGPGRGAVSR